VQEDGRWEEPEGTWEVNETEEEEVMIVNTIQQVESSWQETGSSWLELEEEEESEIYCVRTCHGEGEAVETGWWSPDPKELQFSKGEEEYLIDLLMGGSATDKRTPGEPRAPAAAGAASHMSGERETVRKEARSQGEGQKDGSASGGGSKKAAVGRKEVNNEEVSKGKDESHNKTEVEKGERQGPKGWAPWWPKGRGREGPPMTPVDTGTSAQQMQATMTSQGECSGPCEARVTMSS
jgi:hypothetical protein